MRFPSTLFGLGAGICVAFAGVSTAQTLNLSDPQIVSASVGFDYNEMPRVHFADDGTKHLVWIRGATFGSEGVFAMSAPPASPYGAPVMISLGLDGVRFGFSDGLTVRKSGSNVVASWEGTDFDNRPIWFARSTDDGASWEAAVRADSELPVERAYTAGALFPDGRVAQVWMEWSAETNDLQWRGQDAKGAFGAPSFPAITSPDVPCDCCNSDQAILSDGTVLVAYRNNVNNSNRTVWVARSTDEGATFPVSTKLDVGPWVLFGCPGDPPSMVTEGQDVLVVWKKGQQSVHEILSARSTDGGVTFTPPTWVGGGDGSTYATRPRVARRGDLAVAAWEARDPVTSHFEIWAAASIDGGVSWGPEQMIPGDGTSRPVSQPSVAISPAGEVEIVMKDEQDTTRKLYQVSGTVNATTSAPVSLPGSPISLVAFPNPFRAGTALQFELPARTTGRIVIHDLAGRTVKHLAPGISGGPSEIFWNGTDDAGRPVAAGVYFARLETSLGVTSRRLVRQR